MNRVPMSQIFEDEDLVAWLDGTPFSGTAFEETDYAGLVLSEVNFVDGHQEGPSRDWYSNGQRKAVTWYRAGVQHGEEQAWYPDGSLKSRAVFESGFLLHKKIWSETGELEKEFNLSSDDPLYETLRLVRSGGSEEDE